MKPMQNTKNLGKHKELDWEKEFKKNLWELGYFIGDQSIYIKAKFCKVDEFIERINALLTQQRTELLEEILEKKTDSANCFCDVVTIGDITNLLNKKDE